MKRGVPEGVATAISLDLPFKYDAKDGKLVFPVDGPSVHRAGFPSVSAHHDELMRILEKTDLEIVRNTHNEITLGTK